jgi:hypothetical protein
MRALGIVLVLVGLLWILQGAGLVGGSFMTGQSEWLYIGIITGIVGACVIGWTAWRRP